MLQSWNQSLWNCECKALSKRDSSLFIVLKDLDSASPKIWTFVSKLSTLIDCVPELFLGVVGLYTVERPELTQWQKTLAVVALTLLAFPGDWSSIAVLAILEIGQNRGDFRRQMTRMMLWVAMYALIYALFIDPVYGILQLFAGLTIPLLKRYNGTRGAGRGMKYLFYLYYPAHLFLCGLVRILLYGNVGVMVGGQ